MKISGNLEQAAKKDKKYSCARKTPTEKGTTKTPPEETRVKATEEKEKESSTPKAMRAVVLTVFGGLKTVKILKRPEPTVSEGEVFIRVKACGLNFRDLIVRQGAIDSPPKTPFIPGFECTDEIEQDGEGVTNFKITIKLWHYRSTGT
ncbi:unnamed protein product [Parnassius apollo]|uniref:(apollo) hypothetical protein n=1 Tax=Parnassius apollo TaxID=110799 RepID=A0A8S3WBX6_PARAO|nr:unnamed protein product [Parnassius apollo]